MSDYKNYQLRQLGLTKESLQSKKQPVKETISPNGRANGVIAIGVRGSSTGGFPSGIDQTGIPSETPTGRLGGYEPIPPSKDNSEVINKTPTNPQINSANPITDNPETSQTPHAHQIQQATDQQPQTVTGASTDSDPTLTLKSAMPKKQPSLDIDVSEEGKEPNDMDGQESMEDEDKAKAGLQEAKHKAGCTCGFCANKGSFKKKPKSAADNVKKSFKKDDDVDESVDSAADRDDTGDYKNGSKQDGKVDKKEKVDETFGRHMGFLKKKINLNEARCEDYPCCGHEAGQCPSIDDEGNEVYRCVCGACLAPGSRSSLCPSCLRRGSSEDGDEGDFDHQWESKQVGDGTPTPNNFKMEPEKAGLVKLSEAFEKMRSLAGLGERKVLSNGLWEGKDSNSDDGEESYGGGKHQKGADIQSKEVDANISKMEKDKNYRPAPFNVNEKDSGKWMQDVSKNAEKNHTKGALHKDLGVPAKEKIPTERLKSIQASLHAKSENGALSDKELELSRRVNAALNMRKESMDETFNRHLGFVKK